MITSQITVKIGPESWVLPYIKLCALFSKRGWEVDIETVKTKALTGIKIWE